MDTTSENEESAYRILGLDHGASRLEVRKAYHSLARAHHPDKCRKDDDRFAEISSAYETLTTSDRQPELSTIYYGTPTPHRIDNLPVAMPIHLWAQVQPGITGLLTNEPAEATTPLADDTMDVEMISEPGFEPVLPKRSVSPTSVTEPYAKRRRLFHANPPTSAELMGKPMQPDMLSSFPFVPKRPAYDMGSSNLAHQQRPWKRYRTACI